MRTRIRDILLGLLCFTMGGLLIYLLLTESFSNKTVNYNSCGYTKCTNKVIIDEKGISEAVDKVYDAVVMVQNYKGNQVIGTGTGFVYKLDDKNGYVMTNHHVVSGADRIVLILSNDEEIEATILGSDVYLDLAVLKIDKTKVIKVAEIGSSEKSKLGDTVFTVGSPLGYEYRGSVTGGRLSGKDRLVSVKVGNSSSNDFVMKVLQTDAAINPGNSGGPLVNSNGEVIGINSLKLVEEEVEGMGFAIPIEFAMSHVDKLEKGETIERPMLGISLLNTNDAYALRQNGISLDSNVRTGVVVVNVVENSGASKSGLQKGDVITKIESEKVSNAAYLRYILYKYQVGDTVKITYIRDGKEKEAKIKLVKSIG